MIELEPLQRPKFLRQKDVFLINDVPVKKELLDGEKFSCASNLNLLTSIRTGRVNTFNSTGISNHEGIIATKIFPTYVDYSYYGEPDVAANFDFKTEIKKKKELKELRLRTELDDLSAPIYLVEKDVDTLTTKSIPKHTYYKLEHQKDCYISYRLKEQLDSLLHELREVQPKLAIITGKWGLFFLTGKVSLTQTMGNYKDKKPLGGLTTYRSSIMSIHPCFNIPDVVVLPIYHTVHLMAMPDKIPIMELDLQKIGYMYHTILEKGIDYFKVSEKVFTAEPDKEKILAYLKSLFARVKEQPTLVSCDIETMFRSIIDCIGVTDSVEHGLCIPFAKVGNPNIFSLEDETEIMEQLFLLITHKNCLHVGQHYNYDTSFYNKLWCLDIHAKYDSMIMHHILYNYLPKDLAFLSSMYCDNYTYWKGEVDATKETPEIRWRYNAKDITYTLEVVNVLRELMANEDQELQDLYTFQQEELSPVLDSMMWRGVKINVPRKKELYTFFSKMLEEIKVTINDCIGEDFNINSTKQKQKIFKDLLNIELVKKRGGAETCDAAAMLVYLENYPLYRPFLQLLLEFSSLKIFTNNFLGMKLDEDDRARCQYKIAGTTTGRLASVKNVWGNGTNLMNIPSKGKMDLTQSLSLADSESEVFKEFEVEGVIKLPNVKKIFIPDVGMEICDVDLSGADIQIVAADSQCKWLIDYFDNPLGCGKVYAHIAGEFLQREISPSSREYKTYKAVFHGCVTGDHEVLTPDGWVRVDDFDEATTELAVWDKDTKSIHFEVPSYMTRDFIDSSEDLYTIEGSSFSFLGTQDHRFPYMKSSGEISREAAISLNKTARIPYSGNFVGGDVHYPTEYIQLLTALHADGCVKYTDKQNITTIAWRFTKERKITRLTNLLSCLKQDYILNTYGKVTNIEVKGLFAPEDKYLSWDILSLSIENIKTYVEELQYWDGHVRTSNGVRTSVSTIDKQASEIMQTLIHLTGGASKILTYEREETRQTLYEVSKNNREYYRVETGNRKLVKHTGTRVFCPTTSTGYFMFRHKGHIAVSSNSNYGMGINRLAQMSGLPVDRAKQLQDYYFFLCPEVKAWQANIVKAISNRGYITNIFGRRGWYLNKNDLMLTNKALSFIPQSTIADLVNRAMVGLSKNYSDVEILLQVHDSLVVQYPKEKALYYRPIVKAAMEIKIPYDPILIIPSDIQTSVLSYGDVS